MTGKRDRVKWVETPSQKKNGKEDNGILYQGDKCARGGFIIQNIRKKWNKRRHELTSRTPQYRTLKWEESFGERQPQRIVRTKTSCHTVRKKGLAKGKRSNDTRYKGQTNKIHREEKNRLNPEKGSHQTTLNVGNGASTWIQARKEEEAIWIRH